MGAFLALALACTVVLAAGSSIPSASAQTSSKEPLPIPGAFQLAGSHGFTLDVIAMPPRAGRSGSLLIFASAKGRSVRYMAPATVTESSMQSDLGELGEISVTFQRTNQATSAACGKRTIQFDSGWYEGKIDVQGEEGYTSVEETTVPGNIDYLLSATCSGGGGKAVFHKHPRGAALYVRNPALGPELSVRKSRPGAAARIVAWISEYSNGISIERFASLRTPGGDFRYDRHLRTATVHPPAPFAGSARFDLDKKADQRWSGDLTVDLPGKAEVPLTGPTLRASLVPSE